MQRNQIRIFVVISFFFGSILILQSYFIYKLYQRPLSTGITEQKDSVAANTGSSGFKLSLTPMPLKMEFCGEAVPLDDPEVYERMEFEWVAAQHRVTANWMILKRSTRYFPIIEPILKDNGVPDDFKFLAVAESNLANVTSPANAEGFWQFLAETGVAFGLEINRYIDQRYDVAKATVAACKYLKAAYNNLGSWTCAAASYNMGQGGLADEMEFQRQSDYYKLRLNQETSKYLFRIITWKYIISDPGLVGMEWDPSMGQKQPRVKSITVSQPIPDLVQWSIEQKTDYRMVRYLNPWIRGNVLPAGAGKSYTVLLPAD